MGVVPLKLIWKNHPFVDNLEECQELWDEEHKEEEIYDNRIIDNTKKSGKEG